MDLKELDIIMSGKNSAEVTPTLAKLAKEYLALTGQVAFSISKITLICDAVDTLQLRTTLPSPFPCKITENGAEPSYATFKMELQKGTGEVYCQNHFGRDPDEVYRVFAESDLRSEGVSSKAILDRINTLHQKRGVSELYWAGSDYNEHVMDLCYDEGIMLIKERLEKEKKCSVSEFQDPYQETFMIYLNGGREAYTCEDYLELFYSQDFENNPSEKKEIGEDEEPITTLFRLEVGNRWVASNYGDYVKYLDNEEALELIKENVREEEKDSEERASDWEPLWVQVGVLEGDGTQYYSCAEYLKEFYSKEFDTISLQGSDWEVYDKDGFVMHLAKEDILPLVRERRELEKNAEWVPLKIWIEKVDFTCEEYLSFEDPEFWGEDINRVNTLVRKCKEDGWKAQNFDEPVTAWSYDKGLTFLQKCEEIEAQRVQLLEGYVPMVIGIENNVGKIKTVYTIKQYLTKFHPELLEENAQSDSFSSK